MWAEGGAASAREKRSVFATRSRSAHPKNKTARGRLPAGGLHPILRSILSKDPLRRLRALGSSPGKAKSELFRPTLIPFCDHRDLVHGSASDDV